MRLTKEDKEALYQYRATLLHLKLAGVSHPETMVQPPLLSCEKMAKLDWKYLQIGKQWVNKVVMDVFA